MAASQRQPRVRVVTVTSTEAAVAAVPVPLRIFSWFSRSITRIAIFRFLGFAPGAFYSTPVTAALCAAAGAIVALIMVYVQHQQRCRHIHMRLPARHK